MRLDFGGLSDMSHCLVFLRWSLCRSGNTSSASFLPFILMFRCRCGQVKPLGETSPPVAFTKHVAKWTGLVRTRDQEIATCSCEFVSSFSFSFTGAWQARVFISVWVWMTRTCPRNTGMLSVILVLHGWLRSDAHGVWGLLWCL